MNGDGVSSDRPPKVTRKPRTHKITQDMVDAIVQMLILPVSFIAPQYALTVVETDALVVAMTDLAAQNPWVANVIYSLVTGSQLLEVPMVLGAISVNKLVIAKKLPEMTKIGTDVILESVAARRGKTNEHGKRSTKQAGGMRESDGTADVGQSVRPGMEGSEAGVNSPIEGSTAGTIQGEV